MIAEAMEGRMISHSAELVAVFLVPFLLAGSARAQELSAKQIAQGAFPSTVLVLMEDPAGQPSVLGSGFFVADNLIATNFHVIRGAAKGYAKLVGQGSRFPIIGVAGVDESRDLALLAVNAKAPALRLAHKEPLALGDQALPPLPPGFKLDPIEEDLAEVGDPVYAVGNPEGLEGTFSQGLVSGIRHIDADTILQITAPISPGSSGGPVLNSRGSVVGIAVATFTEGQNLNFAVPVTYLTALLRNRKEPVPFSQSGRSSPSRSHSILEGLGGDSRDGVTVSHFRLFWSDAAYAFSFSLRNELGDPITDVRLVVVFYDRRKQPIDFKLLHFDEVIPPGLAKRLDGGYIESSVLGYMVERLPTEPPDLHPYIDWEQKILEHEADLIDFRVLDFRVLK